MNNDTHSRARSLAGIALLILLGMLAARPAAAQQAWSGLGADNNWSTGANWAGGVPPASGNMTTVSFAGSTPRPASVVDMPWTINRIDFFATHNLSGQALTFAGTSPQLGSSLMATVANPITLAAPLFVTSNSGILQLSGGISGTGPLFLTGSGGVAISGVNTFSGGTSIAAAVVSLTGSMPGPVTVDLGGILAGPGGTVSGAVTVGANGVLTPGTGAAFNTGNLTISGFTRVTIDGPALGTQYSNINVTGSMVLSGATLILNGAYTPVQGDVFIIITNDGTDAVTGIFAGLPEGATVTLNGVPLTISYVGGTGNDVTLTAPAAVIAALRQVPTLSEWALMLLAALLLGIGMLGSRRVR